MACSKSSIFHSLDATLLVVVFIFQSIIFRQYTLCKDSNTLISEDDLILQKTLWLGGDFIILAVLVCAAWCGYQNLQSVIKSRDDPSFKQFQDKHSFLKYLSSGKIPLSYVSWVLYSFLLVLKISIIFKSDIPLSLGDGRFFGPHMLQLALGLSSIVFSLLVEAHHDAGKQDPKRNAYLNSISYEVAIEILDTASFISYLIPSYNHSTHTDHSLGAIFTPLIITLAAINLILPSMTLHKLATTKFGEVYHVRLELIYKILHLLLIDVPFFAVRLHLWSSKGREDVIFGIKNLYAIFGYLRGIMSDIKLLKKERKENRADAQVRNRNESELNTFL